MSKRHYSLLSVISLLFSAGCGQRGGLPENLRPSPAVAAGIPEYQQMRDVSGAPPAIQHAAQAVVHIEGSYALGTGSFISADGLLLTNNHVVGNSHAHIAREGAYFTLNGAYQRGVAYAAGRELWLQPVHLSVPHDAAIYQVWTDARQTERFRPPHFLAITATTADALIGHKVFTIGHPGGGLKKWTEGHVFAAAFEYLESDNFTLGGNSGSPIVDETGSIVALLHSGREGIDKFNRHRVLNSTIGTEGAAITRLLASPPNADILPSLHAATTEIAAADHQDMYLFAKTKQAEITGRGKVDVIQLVGKACTDYLREGERKQPQTFSAGARVCSEAVYWFNCWFPEVDPEFKQCPKGADRTEWEQRFEQLIDISIRNSSTAAYDYMHLLGWLEKDTADQARLIRRFYDRAIAPKHSALGFAHAALLAAADLPKTGFDPVAFFVGYRRQPQYERSLSTIASTIQTLADRKKIDDATRRRILSEILHDENLTVGDRIQVEILMYTQGLI